MPEDTTVEEKPLNKEQIADLITRTVTDLIQKLATTQGQAISQGVTQRNLEDVNTTERQAKDQANEAGLLFANNKRTYDAYQNQELSDGKSKDSIAVQALQNAVENANMLAKRTIAGFDFADNKKWNINETDLIARDALRNNVPQDAIAAMVAKAVSDASSKKE